MKTKLLHNIIYWINPYYMIAIDISKSTKARAFIDENFGHILKPIVEFIAKQLLKLYR